MINGHPPIGIVLGTSAEALALQRFVMGSHICELSSISEEREKIICAGVRFLRTLHRSLPADERHIVKQVIGRFAMERFEARATWKNPGEDIPRKIMFLLNGPSKLWMTSADRDLSHTGEITMDVQDEDIFLDEVMDLIEVRPHHMYAAYPTTDDIDPEQIIDAALYSLIIEENGETERDEAAFCNDSRKIAETLCLIMSFLSKSYISWSSYAFSSAGVQVNTFRELRGVPRTDIRQEDMILSFEDTRPFLKGAYTAYLAREAEDFDILMPLLHYIFSHSARFVDERFSTLFYGLEKIISSLDRRSKAKALLNKTELSKVSACLKEKLVELGKSLELEAIMEKIAELKRPTLKRRLRHYLSELGITYDDIGGDEGIDSMVNVRNRITHQHGQVAIEDIVREAGRLETIVERLLLALLGWTGKSRLSYANRRLRK